MTTTGQEARFHFDPRHDQRHVPDLETFLGWIRTRIRARADDGLPRAVRRCGQLHLPMTFGIRLKTLLPGERSRRRQMVEDICIVQAMPLLSTVHDTMREFGMDLTRGCLSGLIETMVSITILDGAIETAIQRMSPSRRPAADHLTTEQRLAPRWERIRLELESQALLNLFDSRELRAEWPRLVAALRASRDEITTEEVRDQIDRVADRIESALTQ